MPTPIFAARKNYFSSGKNPNASRRNVAISSRFWRWTPGRLRIRFLQNMNPKLKLKEKFASSCKENFQKIQQKLKFRWKFKSKIFKKWKLKKIISLSRDRSCKLKLGKNRKNVLYFVIKEAPEKFLVDLKMKRKNFHLNFSKSKNRRHTFSLNCLISSSNALICLRVPVQTPSKYLARFSFLSILSTNSWDKKWKNHVKRVEKTVFSRSTTEKIHKSSSSEGKRKLKFDGWTGWLTGSTDFSVQPRPSRVNTFIFPSEPRPDHHLCPTEIRLSDSFLFRIRPRLSRILALSVSCWIQPTCPSFHMALNVLYFSQLTLV